MGEALRQSFQNLRANKLRSFLTMFGIVWGMISIVILSATGEGFRLGNEKVLLELGRNVGIVWGNRTSLQAGGERAGRRIFLTDGDALTPQYLSTVSQKNRRGTVIHVIELHPGTGGFANPHLARFAQDNGGQYRVFQKAGS